LSRISHDRRPGHRLSVLRLFAVLVAVCGLSPTPVRAQAANLDDCRSLYQSGRYADCIDATAAILAKNEFNEPFWVLKIRAELELGRYTDALASFETGLKSSPSSVLLRWAGRQACRFNGLSERAAELDAEIGAIAKQSPWKYSDSANQVALGRFYLEHGVDPKRVLTEVFGLVKKRQPGYVDAWLASGDVALEKHDFALAAPAFQQAAKIEPENADAHFGLARSFAESDPEKSQAELDKTLELNPTHVSGLLWIVDNHIDAERYEEAERVLQQVSQVNPHQPRALAYRAVLDHLRNQPDIETRQRDAALKYWSTNPEVDHTIGLKLSQKYRFAEGAEHQRLALAFDTTYVPARLQLAQDLLRLGQEEEGWSLAEEVNQKDGYNIVAHNLVTLQETIAKFRTLERDGLLLRMDEREAEIYGGRVLDLLARAKQALCAKYGVELTGPVIVEMFPRQQDFAIRTFGLPGGAGFLGVCFGSVITANSPASQGETPASWEATLWHEFCHVVTLNKTRNRMPRWLSEGISVYEEQLADPTWGQTITPQYRQMLLGDDLTPVSRLSGAFLNAKSPLHLQFAYFESCLVVEYLVEKHGGEALNKILVDLGEGLSINDALERHTGSLAELDAEFAKYARERANAMAPGADWAEPELPRRADREAIAAWLKDHPDNYPALARLAAEMIRANEWRAARETLEKMVELFPGDIGPASPYRMLARVFHELGENREERAVLQQLCERSASCIDAYERLGELAVSDGDWEMARSVAQRWLAVNPLTPAPHRLAAAAAEKLGDHSLSISSLEAILLLDPIDPAEAHLQLATELDQQEDYVAAKRHALLALEETPRFRQAYTRLFAINRNLSRQKSSEDAGPPPPPQAVPLESAGSFSK
jgi:tetratricopeptide (TPR) repeat protein